MISTLIRELVTEYRTNSLTSFIIAIFFAITLTIITVYGTRQSWRDIKLATTKGSRFFSCVSLACCIWFALVALLTYASLIVCLTTGGI